MNIVQQFKYTNDSGTDLRLVVEPWADQFVLHPGQQVDILVYGDVTGIVEFEQASDRFVVHSYDGSIIHVMSDGKELPPSDQI
ncbi:MAG: hypothetical protein V4505_22335 [Pseudomonadota bacterium]